LERIYFMYTSNKEQTGELQAMLPSPCRVFQFSTDTARDENPQSVYANFPPRCAMAFDGADDDAAPRGVAVIQYRPCRSLCPARRRTAT
jgi:hypothetical protein